MNKQAQAVSRWMMPRGFHALSLVAMISLAQSLPAAAQTRMVNSDGEVIMIERAKPTEALRSRWIKPGESVTNAQSTAESGESADAQTGQEPLGALLDVLGRKSRQVEVEIPMAPNEPETVPEPAPEEARGSRQSSRIEVLGRDDGDELPQILAELLRDSGEQLVVFKIVQTQVSADQIRYFHPSDRSHAEYVASLLDGVFDSLPVRDYSFYRPSPPEGLLEIWIQ